MYVARHTVMPETIGPPVSLLLPLQTGWLGW
jgi:hypothetical protein